jgi:hypothetical protein
MTAAFNDCSADSASAGARVAGAAGSDAIVTVIGGIGGPAKPPPTVTATA